METTISKEYLRLIKRFPLRPIRNRNMLKAASKLFSELGLKLNGLTQDEMDYLSILGGIIREYEDKHYRPIAPRMSPERALRSFMEEHGLTVTTLASAIGAPHSVISEFLSGKRGLSKINALKLGKHFYVSAELFLPAVEKGVA